MPVILFGVDAVEIQNIDSDNPMGMLSVTFDVVATASLPSTTSCMWTMEPAVTKVVKSTDPGTNLLSNPPVTMTNTSGNTWRANGITIGAGALAVGDTIIATVEASWQCSGNADRSDTEVVPAP